MIHFEPDTAIVNRMNPERKIERKEVEKQEHPVMSVLFSSAGVLAVGQANGRVSDKRPF